MKANLACGGLLLCAANYVLFMYSDCFVNTFTVTSSIKCDLDGSISNIVKPMGWIAIGLIGAGIVNLVIYSFWAGAKAKAYAKDQEAKSALANTASEEDEGSAGAAELGKGGNSEGSAVEHEAAVAITELEGTLVC
jgi:hypothetical protein